MKYAKMVMLPNKKDITSKLGEVLDGYVSKKLEQGYEFLKTVENILHEPIQEQPQYLERLLENTECKTEDIKQTLEKLEDLKKVYKQEKELATEQAKQSKDDFDKCLEGHKKNIAESMLKKINKTIIDYRNMLLQYNTTTVSFRYTLDLLHNL